MVGRCRIMGVLNVTPDSFSDGGMFSSVESAIRHGIEMFESGADVVDIGGESTNPYVSRPVDADEEIRRIWPVVKELVKRGFGPLSIDTRHAKTAQVCIGEGATWLNDVSALTFDPEMIHEAKKADCVVLMHARGTPESMQKGEIQYDDVVSEVVTYLKDRVGFCESHGISKDKIIVDPGIGFGKRLSHNIALLQNLRLFKDLGAGVMSGVSRKYFIGELTGIKDPIDRDNATLGAVAHSFMAGANVVRVHNVKATYEMLTVLETLARN